ncbi:Hpt domain-containing protein [Enterovibrio sp. ZSDZ42]|uniref:Hpt domain-containing protein n=1 Tax=Enterovibrio gelatinilyticus TaxID=2899819 RepID=A0ABT5R204_9GAMM|nr:Hpt domain-containing protein [Enterovibrio sp. ZSDZ42]MDD1794297.1 Hpt domain-containing protein [Enterovibrio sp. ZSDZ42]
MLIGRQRTAKNWISLLLWCGFAVSFTYAFFSYSDMKHTKGHATHIVKLNNAAQQLRQTVSASMLNQDNERKNLEKEVQHFRYLLLRTKSHTIEDRWDDIQHTLLEADAFVENVDNLLASIYAVSKVTEQLKQLIDSQTSPELASIYQSIGTYLLFELHGFNNEDDSGRIGRFNRYLADVEDQLAALDNSTEQVQLYALYTSLERINRQLESVDEVINHKFVRSMTQQQAYWTTQVIERLDTTISMLFWAFGLLFAQVLLQYRALGSGPDKTEAKPSVKESSADALVPFKYVEPSEPLFDASILHEQLDGDKEAIESVLTMFVAEHQGDAGHLEKHISQGQTARARSLMHNLKGVSGNIGALALQDFCTHADAKLREGQLLDILVVKQFQKLLSLTIQAVLKEMEQSHKAIVS